MNGSLYFLLNAFMQIKYWGFTQAKELATDATSLV